MVVHHGAVAEDGGFALFLGFAEGLLVGDAHAGFAERGGCGERMSCGERSTRDAIAAREK